jgi:hypothetical protein
LTQDGADGATKRSARTRCGVAPILVNTHDFSDQELGKAIPNGIYDVGRHEGWVSVGVDNNTA